MKQHGSNHGLVAAIPLLLLAWSCSDDQLSPNQNDQSDDEMHFFSYIASDSDSKSRVDAGESKYESFNYQKCENSDIYLITAVEDGIDGTQLATYEPKDVVSECENLTAPESRAMQLTQETLLSKYLNNTGSDGKWAIDLYAYKYPARTTYNTVSATADNLTLSDVFAEYRNDNSIADVVQTIYQEHLTASASATSSNVALTTENKFYWDAHNANRITFFSLFPSYDKFGADDPTKLQVGKYRILTQDNEPILEYCTSTKAEEQIDFLYGQKSYAGSANQSIVLPMRHILTGIKVSLGDGFSGCKIKKIEFDNVDGYGKFNLASGEWLAKSKTDKVTFSSTVGSHGTMKYEPSTDIDKTGADANSEDLFMVVPQGLGANAGGVTGDSKIKITVQYSDGSQKIHTADLNGTTWEAGKTVSYQLSINTTLTSYYITTQYASMKCGWAGFPAGFLESYTDEKGVVLASGGDIRVKSYKAVTTTNGSTVTTTHLKVPWRVMYGNEDGTFDEDDDIDSEENEGIYYIPNSTDDVKKYVYDYTTYDINDADYEFEIEPYNFLTFLYMDKPSIMETVSSDEANALAKHKSIIFGDKKGSSEYYWRSIDLSIYSQAYKQVGNDYTPIPYYQDANRTNISRETANCYMIQFPGYYSIPCVYGNGIHQNASLNNSYVTGASGTYAMGTLKRHDGNNIAGNWINSSNGGNPTDAILLWEDSPGLISYVKLINPYSQFNSGKANYLDKYNTNSASNPYSSGEYYVRFDVASGDNFKPGNAVIAIVNGSTVMWSWHIWVTPWAGSDRITADASDNGTMGKQQYLKRPLGYVERESYKWPARSQDLLFQQYEVENGQKVNKKSCVMTFQSDEHILPRSSCCYYQWGRKDPFPGVIATENTTASYIDSSGNIHKAGGFMSYDGTYDISYVSLQSGTDASNKSYITYGSSTSERIIATSVSSNTTVASGIQHPMWYYTASSSNGGTNRFPPDNSYYDLWGQNQAVTSSTDCKIYSFPSNAGSNMRKTAYDPCPIGFKVPPIHGLPAVSFNGYPCFTKLPSDIDVDENHRRYLAESALYSQAINSPFTDHSDFVYNFGYKFYNNKMTLSGKAGGDTYNIYAFGYIDYTAADTSTGALKFSGFSEMATFWSSSRWVKSATATDSRMMMMKMSYGSLNSSIVPVYGSYNSFGCPIMPLYDTYLPVY